MSGHAKTAAAVSGPVAPTVAVPSAPPLPGDLEALLRRLRMPHTRRLAPEVLATAKAQRWEPVEVLRALLGEEVTGRDRSALSTRRAAAGFPTGKTQAAVERGLRVAWFTLEDIGVFVRRHRADDTVTKPISRVLRADLVVIDLCRGRDYAEGAGRAG